MADDTRHRRTKSSLKAAGLILLIGGGLLAVIGFASFFSAIGSNEVPRLFWMVFVGFPLSGLGFWLLVIGSAGEIGGYATNELAPIVRRFIGKAAESEPQTRMCSSCGAGNAMDARYCDNCGKPFGKTCPQCGRLNDDESSFCDGCGTALS